MCCRTAGLRPASANGSAGAAVEWSALRFGCHPDRSCKHVATPRIAQNCGVAIDWANELIGPRQSLLKGIGEVRLDDRRGEECRALRSTTRVSQHVIAVSANV